MRKVGIQKECLGTWGCRYCEAVKKKLRLGLGEKRNKKRSGYVSRNNHGKIGCWHRVGDFKQLCWGTSFGREHANCHETGVSGFKKSARPPQKNLSQQRKKKKKRGCFHRKLERGRGGSFGIGGGQGTATGAGSQGITLSVWGNNLNLVGRGSARGGGEGSKNSSWYRGSRGPHLRPVGQNLRMGTR